MNVAKNIKEIRREKGITQQFIADALNVDPSVVSNIEKGKRELKVKDLEKIAKALDVDLIYLFTYPRYYVQADSTQRNDRVSITFEVSPAKRDALLKMVVEDGDIITR